MSIMTNLHRMMQWAVMAFSLIAGNAIDELHAAAAVARQPAVLILNDGCWPPQMVFERSAFQKVLQANGYVCLYDAYIPFMERHGSNPAATLRALKQFNLVILVGAQEYDVTKDQAPLPTQKLTEAIGAYIQAGGGVFFMPTTTQYPGNHIEKTANYLYKPFGAQQLTEQVSDETRKYVPANQKFFSYFWTDAIVASPVTTGVSNLFLPYTGDHNSAATTGITLDSSWTVVIRGMPEAHSYPQSIQQFDRVYDPKVTGTYASSPPIMAIKDGKGGEGRMAILPVFPMYTMNNAENAILDDVVLSKGDGYRKSDMKTLLFNTFRWLAEPTQKNTAFGGYVPVTNEQRLKQTLANSMSPFDWSKVTFPVGKKIQKGVVGAHSTLTDGKNSVAEFVAAAKQNQLSFIVFTEPLPQMTKEKWETLKAECAKASDADFKAYPGMEYLDETGATFLEFDMKEFPDGRWITKDGRINDHPAYHFQNGRECSVALCLGDKHKKDTLIDPWHHDLYSHTAVFSYDKDKLIDDSRDMYQHGEATCWSNIPIAFTRIDSVGDISNLKMFTYVQADSIEELHNQFSKGSMMRIGWPWPVFVSGGPIIDVLTTVNASGTYPATGPGKERYRIYLKASSDKGIKEVKIVESRTGEVFRRYLPGGEKQFSTQIDGYHYDQPYLIAYITDVDGNMAVSSCVMTDLQRNHAWAFPDLRNHPVYYNFINDQGLGEQSESTGFGFNRDGNYLGIEVGSKAPVIPSNNYVYGMDGFGTGGFWAHVSPLLQAPGCSEFTGETGDFIFYQGIASADLQTARYTSTNVVYGPHTTWGPRARKPSEYMDATITQFGFRPRAKPLMTATCVRGDVTFKKDVTLDAKTPLRVLYAYMERIWATPGDAAQIVVSDKGKGTLTWKMDPKGKFQHSGNIPFGGYVSVYPQIFVANTPTVLSLTDELAYTLNADGENVSMQLFLAGSVLKTYHTGDHVSYEFVMLQPNPAMNTGNEWIEDFRRNYGCQGELPYKLEVTTGKLQQFKYWLKLTADNGAAQLNIAKTDNLPLDIPTSVSGLNGNCPAGVYDTRTFAFRRIAVDSSGNGYLEINPNDGAKDLFIGNLFNCDQKDVKIEVISSGKGTAEIVVHNPTDTDLKCIVTGNKDFPPLANFKQEMVVKSGSDQRMKSSLAKEWKYVE